MHRRTTKRLLKEIISNDLEDVYIYITDTAIDWMVAGFVAEGNQLLEQLWRFNIPRSRHLWAKDQGLQVIWAISGQTPADIPFPLQDIEQIRQENWADLFNHFYWTNADHKPLPDIFERIATLKEYAHNNAPDTGGYVSEIASGVLLAANKPSWEDALYFLNLWGAYHFDYQDAFRLPYLIRDPAVVKILLEGQLAPVSRLTSAICAADTTAIITALGDRMAAGRTVAYKTFSWPQLLATIFELALQQENYDFPEAVLQAHTLTYAPAEEAAIIATEQRLGIRFPDDYRAFLLTSNGLACFSGTGVTLSPVDNVARLSDVEPGLIDAYALIGEPFLGKFRSSIIIGGLEDEQQLLLIPLPEEKWECWFFANWSAGETVYESFRYYMEKELQRLEE